MSDATHPMVPVPDAMRTVLKQTAAVRLQHPPKPIRLPVSSWKELLNQTLDSDVVMQEPGYPNYNASVMDGYAIRTTDTFVGDGGDGSWTHAVVDRVHAGGGDKTKKMKTVDARAQDRLPQAFYITTGAVVPDGYNCVVPVENCRVSSSQNDEKHIAISKDAVVQDGKWIRKVGCDMAAGSIVLPRGHLLDAVALGLLLQSGVEHVDVKPRIRVGVLSTGNELINAGEDGDGIGRIPDVNRPILLSLLETFGNATPVDLGMERDDNIDSLTQTLQNALERCDVIVTTGGISMGETDVVEHVLVERLHGTLHFGRMHMKPGKPTTFVTIGNPTKLVFAMPGNPVSATVCTQLLVRPSLDLLYHGPDQSSDTHGESMDEMLDRIVQNAWVHSEISATLTHDIPLDKERPEYRRVTLTLGDHQQLMAASTGVQRSSRLQSLRDAQGLMLLPQGGAASGKTVAKEGESHAVLLLNDSDATRRVQVCNSAHLQKKPRQEFKIGLIRIVAKNESNNGSQVLDGLSRRVCEALSGTKSGMARVVSSNAFVGPPQDLFNSMIESSKDNREVDIYVVCCAPFEGSFQYYLDVSSCLRARLDKVADTMALQARRGAASQDPVSALFEVVVGFMSQDENSKGGAMLIYLPESGLDGGLQNVRGLLKHALQVGRSRPN